MDSSAELDASVHAITFFCNVVGAGHVLLHVPSVAGKSEREVGLRGGSLSAHVRTTFYADL